MRSTFVRLICGGLFSILSLTTPGWCQQDTMEPQVDAGWTRDYMMIVGSTTVFPFANAVVAHLVQSGEIKKAMVQPTGSGGGLMLFCAGAGIEDVDITCSSRAMRKREFEACSANGVGEIVQIWLGFDGIALTSSRKAPSMDLSFRDIYLAIASEVPDPDGAEKLVKNPYTTWRDVNPDLPDRPIRVLGPSSGSGTRTIFNRLAMEAGCDSYDWIRAMREEDPVEHRRICRSRRQDDAYMAASENDLETVAMLAEDIDAVALLSFAVVDRNSDTIHAMAVEGVKPTHETISDASYAISRPLYLYVKKAHVGHVPGIRTFLAEVTGSDASGKKGYLADLGLVLLPEDARRMSAKIARDLSPMAME
jgi:phosphate transport system substrate-binding protein